MMVKALEAGVPSCACYSAPVVAIGGNFSEKRIPGRNPGSIEVNENFATDGMQPEFHP